MATVIEKIAPGYRIVEYGGRCADEQFALEYQEPAYLTWQHIFDGPSAAHCRLALEQLNQGEEPQYWEDMSVAE